ncbi:hypothetical protein NQ314_007604 [Rhamnusium bicolor]|uniref:Protein arginine N-methyltransferase n=1 Tax=Rhamnusium bicolor TaxID=1586634 RepID=A0AAV8YK38_9CUCU|nr:hypothetical protein NQ314_007604 [Rhamnusium bicolor]
MHEEGGDEKRKRMSVGLYVSCPANIKGAIETIFEYGYHFIVTQITHPNYARVLQNGKFPQNIGRTDRVLKSSEWSRLVVGELTASIDVDSEVDHIREHSKHLFLQELGFATHLSVPAILIQLTKPNNIQLAHILNAKLTSGFSYSVWVNLPIIHPSRYSPISETEYDTWDWWNDFRTYCNYDKRLGLVLDIPDTKHTVPSCELDRWIGEPVKAIVIPTSFFLINQHGKPVLSRTHQDIIKKFMSIDVQYIIKPDSEGDLSLYIRYLHFLGKKLYVQDTMSEFVQGCEDFLQNPLQPLTEHLETNIYEVFEKDQVKYDTYQNAINKAVEAFHKESGEVPVVMVVGAGRGPLVQAVLNVSYTLNRKVKVYAVEKNPYAVNTLIDRVKNEWCNKVTLINEDMRTYEPPEKADILVSELLGSFGDNELSPECLDGAQRFLKKTGISIPSSYTSYLAPLQSIKIFNEIRSNRPADKTLQTCYEMPYVVHLVNYYQIAPPQELFRFTHPNWSERINNQRYKKLRFQCTQTSVLTGFAGFFETVLYKEVNLSIHPDTHTPDMVSWFPIVFPLHEPIHVTEGNIIEVSFWRAESQDKVWYEWCLESPVKGCIMNPDGRSYFLKKY